MLRTARTLVIALFLLIFSGVHHHAFAAQASGASLRLNNMTTGADPGGALVTFTTSSDVATEVYFRITLDSEWVSGTNFSADPLQYYVNTTDLPAGYTAMPFTSSQALTVSGNTVTYTISNLASSTSYAFYMTSGSSGLLLNPSASTSIVHTLETLDGTSSVIDYASVGVPIVSNGSISVTGIVGTQSSDFSTSLSLVTSGSDFPQDTTLRYKILYSSTLSYSTTITVRAEWTKGTLEGATSATVELLEYKTGSATSVSGSVTPVVDTVNRTVTWTVSVPANVTNKELYFELKTLTAYTGSGRVEFSVSENITSPSVTATQYNSQFYLYSPPTSTPTPTPTPTPTTTTTALTATPTPTPTPTPAASISSITVETIDANVATIRILTETPTTVTVVYGTDGRSFPFSISDPVLATDHTVVLQPLETGTAYYFTVRSITQGLQSATSEIYTFRTAQAPAKVTIIPNKLTVSHEGVLIYNAASPDQDPLVTPVIIPTAYAYELTIQLARTESVRKAEIIIRNQRVLGINNIDPIMLNTNSAELVEVASGVYYVKLQAPSEPGLYDIILRVEEISGSITEQKVSTLRVIPPMYIVGTNGTPIENARVYLLRYNPKTQLYEAISPTTTAIKNPVFSETNGEVKVVLFPGKYKAEISALGFKEVVEEFNIGEETFQLPRITMEPSAITPFVVLTTHFKTLKDALHSAQNYFAGLAQSSRLFHFFLFAATSLFALLSAIAVSIRIRIPAHLIPLYVYRHMQASTYTKHHGKVLDRETRLPLSRAKITLTENRDMPAVVSQTYTNGIGEFDLTVHTNLQSPMLTVVKHGYQNIEGAPFALNIDPKKPAPVYLQEGDTGKRMTFGEGLHWITTTFFDIILESSLMLSIILIFFFATEFSWIEVSPLAALTLGNILLLALDKRARYSVKTSPKRSG